MRSSPFDDDDGILEEVSQGSTNSLWRRPWWRWNLFTLFAVLFVYVWVRELMSLNLEITFWGLMGILGVWVIIPLVPFLLDSGSKLLTFTTEAVKKYHEEPRSPKSLLILVARFIAILILAGVALQLVLSVINLFDGFSQKFNLKYFYGSWRLFVFIISLVMNGVFNLALSIALWMLADILQNQEEMKSKQEEPK